MKKRLILIIIIAICIFLCINRYNKVIQKQKEQEKHRIENIKSGWYVEITNDYLNVRKEPESYSKKITEVHKGEIYEAIEYVENNSNYFWYKIKIDDKTVGYAANPKKSSAEKYLNDYNNPTDLYYPKLSFQEEEYYVDTINDINYDHLTLWDDKDGYVITHKVYHEYLECLTESNNCEPKDQYWIRYTITDAVGKSSSKTQKIIFKINPSEKEVLDFYKEYEIYN